MSEKKKTIRKDGKKAVSYRLPVDLIEEIDEVCKEYGFTKSAFVERAIKKTLENLIANEGKLFR